MTEFSFFCELFLKVYFQAMDFVYRMPNRTWGLNPMHNFVSIQRCLLSSWYISFISLSLFPTFSSRLGIWECNTTPDLGDKEKEPSSFQEYTFAIAKYPILFFFTSQLYTTLSICQGLLHKFNSIIGILNFSRFHHVYEIIKHASLG